MLPETLQASLKAGELMVAEVPASTPARRGWVGVYPYQRDPANRRSGLAFSVRWVEIDRIHDTHNFDKHSRDLTVRGQRNDLNEGELEQVLQEWVGDLTHFTVGQRTDYPL